MSVNPLAQRMRPQMPAGARPVRRNRDVDFSDIPMGPGDPGWRRRIPPPDNPGIGEVATVSPDGQDAFPLDPDTIYADGPLSAQPPAPGGLTLSSSRRAAVYPGRGKDFILTVEEAPEWETAESWKLSGPDTLRLVDVLEAFNIKVQDRTGGELRELRQHKTGRQNSAKGNRARPQPQATEAPPAQDPERSDGSAES